MFTVLGIVIGAFYVMIWMFNGKRSHSLMGVLVTVCIFYITKLRRPSWPVLISTAFAGAAGGLRSPSAGDLNGNTVGKPRSFSPFWRISTLPLSCET